MFYRYEIKNRNNRNSLFLYISLSEEEASEFSKKNEESLEDKVKNFIKQNNIDYNEGPVYIVCNNIIIKSIDIKNKKITIEELIEKELYSNNKFIVKVKHPNNEISIITLKDYLTSALLTNISYEYNVELIKGITILFRTYAYKQMAKDGYILANDNFIKYKSIYYYKLLLFHDFDHIISNFKTAIDETDCVFITYNNLFIKPYFHIANNGSTDTLENIPYLEKTPSLWDLDSEYYLTSTKLSIDEVCSLLNISKDNFFGIKILSLTEAGCIDKIKIGYKIYSGDDIKDLLNLPSKDMTILINQNDITFINRGTGNNLGLSLEGGNALANEGCNYLQIINYYFKSCKIKKYI